MVSLFATFLLFLLWQDGSHARENVEASTKTTQPAVHWGPCDPTIVTDPSLSCGFFEVPLDYNDPSVGKGRLAVIKANATGERRGTLFMNPGGPGVSGLSEMDETSALLLEQTGGLYDVVSWDPRGVGSLTIPGDVFCFDGLEDYNTFWNGTIELNGINTIGNFTDQFDIDALLSESDTMQKKYDEVGKRCKEHSDGSYLKYTGTAATVRDMVALADVLDGPGSPVNFLGLSYGTLLGSWFVNMFPERVGRVILDGVVDPNLFMGPAGLLGWSAQVIDSDMVYTGLVTGCALAGPGNCTIAAGAQSPADVNNNIQKFLKVAHDAELVIASVPITPGLVRTDALWPYIYLPSDWVNLTNQILPQVVQEIEQEVQSNTNATKRSYSPLQNLFKRAMSTTVPNYSTQGIMCADAPDALANTTMRDVFKTVISTTQNVSHIFGSQWPSPIYYCSFWPERAVERYQGPFNKTLANRILVIGNTYDPVTPFAGAQAVANMHRDQATLVRMNGFGHTSQAAAGQSTCINRIIAAYMTNGTLPSGDDTVCEVDDAFEIWPSVNTRMILKNLPRSAF